MDSLAVRGNFTRENLKTSIDSYIHEIRELYLNDAIPWVIGYSGGKDSTAVVQLIWQALRTIPKELQKKEVHVISTDTLVENPIVSTWLSKSLFVMNESAKKENIPIKTHLLKPDVNTTFWVNFIGRGYPAPRNNFRWCTDRLKIRPSNIFIKDIVNKHGEAILLLGMRKAESATRSRVIEKYENKQIRDHLNPSSSLPNCLVYSVISDWSNDDVWFYLLQYANPWNYNNKDLLSMYSGATADGECPLVVDTSTPSCGNSRFGCWICTLVEEDKSMAAMIKNDIEKEWMLPLLQFRNNIDFRTDIQRAKDHSRRDFRRMSGIIQTTKSGEPVPGPYIQQTRKDFLKDLLIIQENMKKTAPKEMKDYEIISLSELERIREIWIYEKNETEDLVPQIYFDITGRKYPGKQLDDHFEFSKEDLDLLLNISDNKQLYELCRNLLAIERQYKTHIKRSGIFDQIRANVKKYNIINIEEAKIVAETKFNHKNLIDTFMLNSDSSVFKEME